MTDVGPEALDLLTVDEVAVRLRCSVRTVRRLVYAERKKPEESFAADLGAGITALDTGGERDPGVELRVEFLAIANEFEQRLEHGLPGLAHQQAAVVGGAAIIRHDGCAGIDRKSVV